MKKVYLVIFLSVMRVTHSDIHFVNSDLREGSSCTTSSNENGSCKKDLECPLNKKSGLRKDICLFEGNNTIVCCAMDYKTSSKTHSTTTESLSSILANMEIISITPLHLRRVSEQKFMEYMEQAFGNRTTVEFPNDREQSLPGKYPHMSAIGFTQNYGKVDWKCGGSLISKQFVLTAGHCAALNGQVPNLVRVGDLNLLENETNTAPQNFRIQRIYVHPLYNSSSHYNDIALLKLSRKAIFTEFVYPASLWNTFRITQHNVVAMGYGTTQFGGVRSYKLTEMNLTLITNRECNDDITPTPQIKNGIINSQICARDLDGDRDTCQGDSGGPLQFNDHKNGTTYYHLVGITSFGISCGSRYPGVYTRISHYIDWIERIVWP